VKDLLFDASALSVFFRGQEGAATVKKHLVEVQRGGGVLYVSALQAGEIYHAILRDAGRETARRALDDLERLGFRIMSVESADAMTAAELKNRCGLHYSDAVAAAMAMRLGCALVTTDDDFKKVEKTVKVIWV
jgi:predicted nucleic acid-binding protein